MIIIKTTRFYCLNILFILILSTPAMAGNDKNHRAIQELTVLLDKIKSSSAEFFQSVKDPQGKLLQYSSGSMKIKRPQRFLWETVEPYEQLISSDGETLWIFDKDLEQVTVQGLNQQVGNTPALLFSGDPALITQHFRIQYGSFSDDGSLYESMKKENLHLLKIFDLYPNDSKAAFKSMSLIFENDRLMAMELSDHLGQQTNIVFNKIKVNPRLSDKIFVFKPPEGVDIIHNTPPSQ